MAIPFEYQNAQRHFQAFLAAVKDAADHETTNQAFTTVDAVFRVFALRLDAAGRLAFARTLPPVLRALFLEAEPGAAPRPFLSREDMTVEVLKIREHHNFSPANSIFLVARELRRVVEPARFDNALATLPSGAAEYWRV